MLYFYRVPDEVQLEIFIETQGDGYTIDEIFLGSISLEDHLALDKILPKMNISHFEDKHIDLTQTKILHSACETAISRANTLQNGSSILPALNDLCSMLEKAISVEEGIIAICD